MKWLADTWQALKDNRESLVAATGIVSSLIAAAGLTISARAMTRQAAALDASGYLDLVHRLAEAQRKVREADTSEEREFEENELWNLLEGIAQLYLNRRLGRSTRQMVRAMLGEGLAFVLTSPEAQAKLDRAITSQTTFAALAKFERRHRRFVRRHLPPVA